MVLLGDVAQVEARFGQFGDSGNRRCMVCVERTIGSDIVMDALDGTLR